MKLDFWITVSGAPAWTPWLNNRADSLQHLLIVHSAPGIPLSTADTLSHLMIRIFWGKIYHSHIIIDEETDGERVTYFRSHSQYKVKWRTRLGPMTACPCINSHHFLNVMFSTFLCSHWFISKSPPPQPHTPHSLHPHSARRRAHPRSGRLSHLTWHGSHWQNADN